VNETAYNGAWGRPQRDGPALRALTIIPYTNYLLDRGLGMDLEYVKERIYDGAFLRKEGRVLKNDLEEVAAGWWKSSFDLWEEV